MSKRDVRSDLQQFRNRSRSTNNMHVNNKT